MYYDIAGNYLSVHFIIQIVSTLCICFMSHVVNDIVNT